MTLDSPLRIWHAMAHNTWFPIYCTNNKLYYREAYKIRVLGKAPTSGFFYFVVTTTTIPLHSHLKTFTQIGQSIWTQRQHNIWSPEEPDLPPGCIIANTLCNPHTDTLILGSDGCVHLADEVATCVCV